MGNCRSGVVLISVAAFASAALAALPTTVGFQGRLVGSDGEAAEGVLTMVFSAFPQAEGGSEAWTETQTVAIADGFYAVQLGSDAAFPDDLFARGAMWLEVSIGGSAMTPRLQIGAAPFALVARDLKGGAVDANSIRVGGEVVIDADGRFQGPTDNLVAAVVAASGGGAGLNAATLGGKEPDAFVTRDDLQAQGFENLLTNGGFERWSQGAPAAWAALVSPPGNAGGSTVAVGAQAHSGAKAVQVKDSSLDVRFCLEQAVFTAAPTGLVGKSVTLGFAARKTDSGSYVGQVVIDDGGSSATLALPPGSAWQAITLGHTVAAGATRLVVRFCPTGANAGEAATYEFDSAMLTVGSFSRPFMASLLDQVADALLTDLDVPGNATIGGNLAVGEDATVFGGLSVNGDVAFAAGLSLGGFGMETDGAGDLVLDGNAGVAGDLSVLGDLAVTGNLALDGTVDFGGGTTANLNLEVSQTAVEGDCTTLGRVKYDASAGMLAVCNGQAWARVPVGKYGESRENPAKSCKDLHLKRSTLTSGVYFIKPGRDVLKVWCDMRTDGGGWTLVGYSWMRDVNTTSFSGHNMPSLRCGGGVYEPDNRGTAAAAIPAVDLVKLSTEFGMSFGTDQAAPVYTGDLDAYARAYKFPIPDPSKVHFRNHSRSGGFYDTTEAGVGPCVGVTVSQLVGGAWTATRYTLKYTLGLSWSDAFPTGYGAGDDANCGNTGTNFTNGPFISSIHSGSGKLNTSDMGRDNECDIQDGHHWYTWWGLRWHDAKDKVGSAAIWLK